MLVETDHHTLVPQTSDMWPRYHEGNPWFQLDSSGGGSDVHTQCRCYIRLAAKPGEVGKSEPVWPSGKALGW